MVWTVLLHLVGLVADLVVGARRTADAKDLEIALRRSPRPPRLSRWEQLTLAVLAAKLGAWSQAHGAAPPARCCPSSLTPS